MNIYLDESGDLGWNFDAPYQRGGSSRYLTLAFLFLPNSHYKRPNKIIKSLYKKYGWIKEKKASTANIDQKILFCEKAIHMIQKYPDIKIDVIVTKKMNVHPHIRTDSNKLYNYKCGLVIPHYVCNEDEVKFIPDKRSIKVKSGNSLIDYLKIKLWLEQNCNTDIKYFPKESHKNYYLQFVDWIAHCTWIHHENSESRPYKVLQSHINTRHLFF